MHKNGKWAKQLIDLQESDGKWGWFHTLSGCYGSPVTTEQALRRLERLGYTIEDDCIQKAVSYMDDCLTGKAKIPDRIEKSSDWDIFTSLMLAAAIRRFTRDNPHANKVAEQWSQMITQAFKSGAYDHQAYVAAYQDTFGKKPKGGRLTDFVGFHQISLLQGCLDGTCENAVVSYVLSRDTGIYYVYNEKIAVLPERFESRKASNYLGAIELLAEYKYARHQLKFVADWLNSHRAEDGKWDMGPAVQDKLYFPLSDDWRKREVRKRDCTERMEGLLRTLAD